MWKLYNNEYKFEDNKIYLLGMATGTIILGKYHRGKDEAFPYFQVLLKDSERPANPINMVLKPGSLLSVDLNFVMEYPDHLPKFMTVEDEYGVTHTAECYHDPNEPYCVYKYEVTQLGYNPDYGDSRVCKCGHRYDRHFDFWENPPRLGCKYCACEGFKLRTLEDDPKCEICEAPLDDPQDTVCPHCLKERRKRI